MSDVQMSAGATVLWEKIRASGKDETGVPLNLALDVIIGSYSQLFGEVALVPDVQAFRREVAGKAARGESGAVVAPNELVELARKLAVERGQSRVFERDLVAAAATFAGVPVRPIADRWQPATGPAVVPNSTAKAADGPAPEATPAVAGRGSGWTPYAAAPTLETLGRDLTAEAATGRLGRVVGRDEETQLVIETLCRDFKRNPLLLGPAGVGKTAIIEGLAQRVVRGEVPKSLRNVRIFALQATDLVQGMGLVGALEERMKKLITEAEQPGLVLFLDEIHAVVGAGAGGKSSNDVANILKPALARGAMACIGATTDGEYSRYLAGDAAFERRFQPLRVNELGREATLEILQGMSAKVRDKDNILVEEAALEAAVSLSVRFMRNRYLPDKAIDVFQHALARARVAEQPSIGVQHVHDVVRRMVSVPVDGHELTARLERLEEALCRRGGVDAASAHQLAQRLRVTMRSMDLHPARPNLVVVATGTGEGPVALARLISEHVFGADAPLIEQDMSILQHPSDVSRLVGTAPGYVGYDEPLQLHLELGQRPWSVVIFRGADLAHPAVQTVLAQAIQKGYLLASSGKKVYLSDTICVLTVAGREAARGRTIGFVTSEPTSGPGGSERSDLEDELAAFVDVVCHVTRVAGFEPGWVVDRLLQPMAEHYRRECNVLVSWDEAVPAWLAEHGGKAGSDPRQIEMWFENEVVPMVVTAVGDKESVRGVHLGLQDDALRVEPSEGGTGSEGPAIH
ncbi:MAG TPA: AAA family ATPase [Thermoanaerobaculaceae bacterium]|nr:AAA family ATPase [Thermoanaerobaculaceae bacterium]HPS76731.1 AAA family ATPase [Thermoanaerobaculaceae bacterium]